MDNLNLKGCITLIRYENGKFDKKFYFENLITDLGFLYIAKAISGDIKGINKIGLGDNNTPETINDKSLANKIVMVDSRKDYPNNRTVRFLGLVPENTFNKTVYYREAGLIYKSDTEEILITRVTFPENEIVYQKPNNSFSFSYEIKLS